MQRSKLEFHRWYLRSPLEDTANCLQCAHLGKDVTGDVRRGDLIFWDGHVGMMVDADTMIHANAHHMATRYEPLAAAIIRIETQGDGPVTARKRLGD